MKPSGMTPITVDGTPLMRIKHQGSAAWMGRRRSPIGGVDSILIPRRCRPSSETTWGSEGLQDSTLGGVDETRRCHSFKGYTWVDRTAHEATIEEPKVFTRPWKISMPLYRRMERTAELLEYSCPAYLLEQEWNDPNSNYFRQR
jgi:hypothetical protein